MSEAVTGIKISFMVPVENRCPASTIKDLAEYFKFPPFDSSVIEKATITIFCDLLKDHAGKHRSEVPEYEWESE